jgi:hypothetical protein
LIYLAMTIAASQLFSFLERQMDPAQQKQRSIAVSEELT